jgi:hypothetical protein
VGDPENLFQISVLKEFLRGIWNLERRVLDRRAGQAGSLSGAAAFEPEGEGLLYREEGHLSIGGYDGPALQSYRYAFPAAAKGNLARAAVHFSDGRFFHDLDLSAGAWRCMHLCDPDRYEGAFTALGPDEWRVVWTVAGPRKDLTLDSRYRRRL